MFRLNLNVINVNLFIIWHGGCQMLDVGCGRVGTDWKKSEVGSVLMNE